MAFHWQQTSVHRGRITWLLLFMLPKHRISTLHRWKNLFLRQRALVREQQVSNPEVEADWSGAIALRFGVLNPKGTRDQCKTDGLRACCDPPLCMRVSGTARVWEPPTGGQSGMLPFYSHYQYSQAAGNNTAAPRGGGSRFRQTPHPLCLASAFFSLLGGSGLTVPTQQASPREEQPRQHTTNTKCTDYTVPHSSPLQFWWK